MAATRHDESLEEWEGPGGKGSRNFYMHIYQIFIYATR
jgi:hypothetical protein